MKRKTKLLLIGACFVICLCGVLLFVIQNDSTEQIIYTVVNESFERGTPAKTPEKIQPELDEFLNSYLPIIADASPEVQAVMKQFEPTFRTVVRDLKIERFLPADEWLQKLLDMGVAIDTYSHYSGYLNLRYQFWHAHNDPEFLLSMKYRLNLNTDASWDEVVEAGIWNDVKLTTLTDEAMASDPLVEGGTLSKDGVFIPFRANTIYIQTNGSQVSSIKGVGVPDWVPQELHHRAAGIPPERAIPKHVEVIFLDDAGKPVEEKVAQSRAQRFQLEPHLIEGAEPVNASDTESVVQDEPLTNDVDIPFEPDDGGRPERSRPDADLSADEIPTESDLEAGLIPKLPADMPLESDVEKSLNDVERILGEPESEDDLQRLIESNPKEREQELQTPPSD